MTTRLTSRSGFGAMGFLLIMVIVVASLLALQTAAVTSVASTSRAFEIARQNALVTTRLERVTMEAVQSVGGVALSPAVASVTAQVTTLLGAIPHGDSVLSLTRGPDVVIRPDCFPQYGRTVGPLGPPSPELLLLATAELRELMGPKVIESPSYEFIYALTREVGGQPRTYRMAVQCRLLGVPLSRYAIAGYDLPAEIGVGAGSASWPAGVPNEGVMPRGLVPRRDPATVESLISGNARPGYFSRRAALAETYQYVFSQSYINRLIDFAGPGRFVDVAAGPHNPVIPGGQGLTGSYRLDVGQFHPQAGEPVPGASRTAVLYSSVAGSELTLSDSGGEPSALFLVVLGPANVALGQLRLTVSSPIQRPVVILGANIELSASGGLSVNGALLLDPDSSTAVSITEIRAGHLSYWLGSARVNADRFHPTPFPAALELMMPRAVYTAAAARRI